MLLSEIFSVNPLFCTSLLFLVCVLSVARELLPFSPLLLAFSYYMLQYSVTQGLCVKVFKIFKNDSNLPDDVEVPYSRSLPMSEV